MGKKTNWTPAEDLALCRAWLHASDSGQLQAPEHRASTFWMAVHQLFHAELGATVERPVNGLKIRWTRINRDVQKFAVAHAAVLAATREGVGALDAAPEAQLVAEARAQFEKERATKFLFESCWRLLRYSPKWMLNLSNATGVAAPPPPTSLEDRLLAPERPVRQEDAQVALSAESFHEPPALQTGGHKRRAPGEFGGFSQDTGEQLAGVAGVLVDELRRRNELLEEQNAMALLRLDADMAGHDDARAYLGLLRQRYLKKMRLAVAVAVAEQPATSEADAHLQPAAGDARPGSETALGELEEEAKSEELAV